MNQHPSTQHPASGASTAPAHSAEARLAAIELFLQQLVLVVECEQPFRAEHLARWMTIASRGLQTSGAASPATVAALRALQHKVLAL